MCPWSALRPEEALMSMDTFRRIAAGLDQVSSVDLTAAGARGLPLVLLPIRCLMSPETNRPEKQPDG
jgi:hypothetical protein